jgi:choice-of-anchor B domain-containing protein
VAILPRRFRAPLLALAAIAAILAPLTARAQVAFNCSLLTRVGLAEIDGDARVGNDVAGYVDPATGEEYAIIGVDSGTGIFNVTRPAERYRTGFIAGQRSVGRDFAIYRNFLYVGSEGGGGIQIIDLSDPEAPVLAGSYTATLSQSHTLEADTLTARLYANGVNEGRVQGMQIFSIADPAQPSFLGTYRDHYVHDCYARNDTVYASAIYRGLFVLDTRDPADIDTLAFFATPYTATHNAWPSEDGNTLLASDETLSGMLSAWDISDLASPIELARYERSEISHNVYVRGSFAFLSHYRAGLRILDITDPARLIEVARYDTHPETGPGFTGAWGAYPFTRSGNVFVSDMLSGLFVIAATPKRGGTIGGIVTDGDTGAPLEGARIEVTGLDDVRRTNALGEYEIGTAGGTYALTVSRDGYFPASASVTIEAGAAASHNVALLNSAPRLVIAEDAAIRGAVAAGDTTTVAIGIRNAGRSDLAFSLREEVIVPSELTRDPAGDRIELTPSASEPVDAVAIGVKIDSGAVEIDLETAGSAFPDSSYALVFLDLDQNPATGLVNPLQNGFGIPANHDVGAERLVLWDLGGRILPASDAPVAGTAALLTPNLGQFYGFFDGELENGSAGVRVALDAETSDVTGVRAAAAAIGWDSYRTVLWADPIPNAGFLSAGLAVVEDPWFDARPDSGTLAPGESLTVLVTIAAPSDLLADTLAGQLVLRTNDATAERKRIPAVAIVDGIAPRFSIALLQNPILSSFAEIVVTASEPLRAIPTLALGEEDVPLRGDPAAERPRFVGSGTIAGNGEISLETRGTDLAGNDGEHSKHVGSIVVAAGQAVDLMDPTIGARFIAPEGAVALGTRLLLADDDDLAQPWSTDEAALGPPFFIGPRDLAVEKDATILIAWNRATVAVESPAPEIAIHRRETGDSQWERLPSSLSHDGMWVVAVTRRLGTYQLRVTPGATAPSLPDRPVLGPSAPNPFVTDVALSFTLARAEHVRLAIYDLSGRLVRLLANGGASPGPHTLRWDGRNETGNRVAAGAYVLRLETPGTAQTRKITALR